MGHPEQIGPFEVLGVIDSGGAGAFYHARERFSGRAFTLWRAPGKLASAETRARLLSEISLAEAANGSDQILSLLGIVDADCALVYAPVNGLGLRAYMDGRGGRLSAFEIREVMGALLRALDHAHQHGVLHRGLCPQVVFVDDLLRDVKIAGFGVAGALETERSWARTQSVFGEAEYMAPEQFLGEFVDPRTDVYSAGMVLYALICGKTPFQGRSIFEVMQGHTSMLRPDPSDFAPGISPELSAILRRATARAREDRFPDARSMLAALEASGGEATALLPLGSKTSAFTPNVASWGASNPAAVTPEREDLKHRRQEGHASSWTLPNLDTAPKGQAPNGSAGAGASGSGLSAQGAGRGAWLPSQEGAGSSVAGPSVAGAWSAAQASNLPPQRSETASRPFYKRWWFVALACFGVALLMLEIFLPGDPEPKPSGGHTQAQERPSSPLPSDPLGSFDGECAWELESGALGASSELSLVNNGAMASVTTEIDEGGRLMLRSRSGDALYQAPIEAGGVDELRYWHAPESQTHWVLMVTRQASGRPSRVIVTQIHRSAVLTVNELFVSQGLVDSVSVNIAAGAHSCEFEIAVAGDRGRGDAEKSMRIAPTPSGVIVVAGALGDLWTDIEGTSTPPLP